MIHTSGIPGSRSRPKRQPITTTALWVRCGFLQLSTRPRRAAVGGGDPRTGVASQFWIRLRIIYRYNGNFAVHYTRVAVQSKAETSRGINSAVLAVSENVNFHS